MEDYVEMLRNFETKIQSIAPDTIGLFTLRMSVALKEYYDQSDEVDIISNIKSMNLNEEVKFEARKWFRYPIGMTIGHIAGLLKELELKNVSTIFLVGGFGECKLVQEAMKKAVERRTVIVSDASF